MQSYDFSLRVYEEIPRRGICETLFGKTTLEWEAYMSVLRLCRENTNTKAERLLSLPSLQKGFHGTCRYIILLNICRTLTTSCFPGTLSAISCSVTGLLAETAEGRFGI